MKTIDTSLVLDPSKKQPFTANSLRFLQESKSEDVAAIIKSIVTSNLGSYSLTVPYVISGCVVSDSNKDVTAGEIFYGGKYYETTAVNGTTNVAQFILTKSQDATADPIEFTNGDIENVHNIYKYVATDAASGGDFDATDLVSLYGSKEYANLYSVTGYTVGSGTLDFTSMSYTTPNDGVTRLYIIEYKGTYVTSSGNVDASCIIRIRNTTAGITLDEGRVGKSNFVSTAVPTGSAYLNTGVVSIAPNTTIKVQGVQVADNVTFEYNRLSVTEFK